MTLSAVAMAARSVTAAGGTTSGAPGVSTVTTSDSGEALPASSLTSSAKQKVAEGVSATATDSAAPAA